MDSSSRRAFGLDSRTVWVEQQLVNNVLLPRDNLPLGPGEYHTKIPERHICTPSLGKFRGPADHFRSFKSDIKVRSPGSPTGPYARQHYNEVNASPVARSEFSTIFHEHDIRQPLDPNKRFCQTPGAYLSQDPLLRSVGYDGIKTTPKIHFGPDDIPFGERNEYRVALPEYEIKYDSKVIKPATKLGTFDKNKREIKFGRRSYYDDNMDDTPSPQRSPNKNRTSNNGEHVMSVYEMRCSLVPLPKLKTRKPEKLTFNDSSYQTAKTKEPLDLTPSKINKVASVHLFDGLVAIPRKHVSVGLINSPSKANNSTTSQFI